MATRRTRRAIDPGRSRGGPARRSRNDQPTQQFPTIRPGPTPPLAGRRGPLVGAGLAAVAAVAVIVGLLLAQPARHPAPAVAGTPTAAAQDAGVWQAVGGSPTAAAQDAGVWQAVAGSPTAGLPPAAPAAVAGTAAPTPSSAGEPSPVVRLAIPAIGVDAPVVVKGLDVNRVMEAPDTPTEVAWYDFSARPGQPGNAVFSGHLDFAGVGPAVFWRLRDLVAGDEIRVTAPSGTVYRYRVVSKAVYVDETAPVDRIIGPTQSESITLITCAGTFNHGTGRYESRMVVRAERIAG